MAKNSFLDWDTVANNNTDVGGVNIAEGCAPSGINNGMRTQMAQLRSGVDGKTVYLTKAANYTALGNDNNAYLRFTAAATLSLTAVATLAANWHIYVQADGGDVIVDPNASELINGATTVTIKNGESALIISSGTAFFARINSAPIYPTIVNKATNYTALDTDFRSILRFTAAATLSIDVTANLRTGYSVEVWADGGIVTVDPNSTDTINGATTLVLQQYQKAVIFKTGATTFQANVYSDAYSGPQLQGYYFGLGLTTAAGDTANDITIAAGAAAADTSPYYLMQLGTAITKQIDAAWAVGNNAGGLDTGSVANSTYYIWLIQRSDTGVTDALFSLSSTAPTMPTNYDRKRLIGRVTRVSAINQSPSQTIAPFQWVTVPRQASTSGTAIDFTSIPATATEIELVFNGTSLSGTDQTLVQLGVAGVPETTGYLSSAVRSLSTVASSTSTAGFVIRSDGASTTLYGVMKIRMNANGLNQWDCDHMMQDPTGASGIYTGSGNKSLAGTLNMVRVTRTGTNTFDAGSIDLRYR